MSTNLEVYDHTENENSCQQIHQIWEVLSVEGFSESSDFVSTGGKEMEQCDNSTLKFST